MENLIEGEYFMSEHDDELMDMWMLGMLDDNSKKGSGHNNCGGCLTSMVLMISIPIMMVIAVSHLL